ncbi:alpha/beta-hydrolase [Trametes sanguinea]|nr:alpha/beta-hydrolase [Trametes sanguinea]
MVCMTTAFNSSLSSPRLGEQVRLTATRYLPVKSNEHGMTLLFFHCAGSHKEVWEPTIRYILMADACRGRGPLVREAWSFDMPNHGEAAYLNRELLERLKRPFTVEDFADILRVFFASGNLAGHRLIAIGHSLGATAMLLATLPDILPPPPYAAVLMVEPALISPECYKSSPDIQALLEDTAKGVLKRRDTWPSREQAKEYFRKRFPWNNWDSRVLDLYVVHALREVEPKEGLSRSTEVTLCCTKAQESHAYAYHAPHFRTVELFRSGMDPSLPVHWIMGEHDDLAPKHVHESVMKLRPVVSTRAVPDAGHFVVQENPDGLGAAILEVLVLAAVPKANL